MTEDEFYNSVSILWIEDNRGIVWNATPIRGDELEVEGNCPNITLTRIIPKEVVENINADSTERKIYIPNKISIYEKSNATKGEVTINYIDTSRGGMKIPNKESKTITGNLGEKVNYSCPQDITIDFEVGGEVIYILDKTKDYEFSTTITEYKKVYKCYYDIAEDDYIPEETTEYNVTFEVGTGATLLYNDIEQSNKTFSLSEVTFSQYTATKDNNKFIGWATYDNKDTCDNSKLKTSSTTQITEDITYYACYINNSSNDNDNQTTDNDNQTTNPPTGSFSLYIIYVLGITALCYTFYFIHKIKKAKNI